MTALAKKLKIKENTEVVVVNAPSNYEEVLGELPEGASIKYALTNNRQFVQLFVKNKAELDEFFEKTLMCVVPGGMMWITYPKGTSKIQTDLTRDEGWADMMKHDLQWNALISFDDTWSAFAVINQKSKGPSKASQNYNALQGEWIDAQNKVVKVPVDLELALSNNPVAWALFNQQSFTNRKEFVLWVVGAKTDATREKRISSAIEKLLDGKRNPTMK